MAEGPAASALPAIDFPAALDQVSQYAVTPLGAARVRALAPRTDVTWIALELGRVFDVARLLDGGADLEPAAFPDITAALARLRLDGAVLDGAELATIAQALAAARVVAAK